MKGKLYVLEYSKIKKNGRQSIRGRFIFRKIVGPVEVDPVELVFGHGV
jgi:hypothetical protein